MAKDDYALVIGINSYSGGIRTLEGCHTDATRFRDWLVSKEGGDVPKEHITFVLSTTESNGDKKPGFDDIEIDVLNLIEEFEKAKRRLGRLYLYFAGHGIQPLSEGFRAADCLVLVANATSRLRRTVHANDTAELFRKMAAFEQVVLFVDCCLEPVGRGVEKCSYRFLHELEELYKAAIGASVELVYGVATSEYSRSYELPLTEPGHTAVMRGRFTFSLLEGLRCAIDPEKGGVTFDSLAGYTKRRMERHPGPSQVPQFSRSDLVLCHPPAKTTPIVVTLNDPKGGLEVRRGPTVLPIVPVQLDTANQVLLQLVPGVYELRRPAPRGVATTSLELEVWEAPNNVEL